MIRQAPLTAAIAISVGLMAAAAHAAVCPVLTIRDCCGNVVKTYDCPTPGVTPVGFDVPAGTQFQSWQVTAGSVALDTLNNPTYLFAPLAADATIQSVCSPPYTLYVQDCAGNVVNAYECPAPGATAVGFTPADGYAFNFWQITGSVVLDILNNPTYLFTPLTANATIRANCTTLVKLTVLNGTATTPPLPGGWYWPNQTVTIVADPPPGAIFTQWISDPPSAQFGDAAQPDTTVMVSSTMTVTADFRLPVLTILDCDGSELAAVQDPLVGTTVYAFAPPQGNKFAGWQVIAGNASLDDPANLRVVVDAPLADNATLQAHCLALPRLTVVNGSALTPPELPGGYYNTDQVVSITADKLPEKAVFTGWTSSPAGAEFGNPALHDTTVKVNQTLIVTANYHLPTLTILGCDGGLMTSIENPTVGTTLFTFSPPAQSTFNGWQVVAGTASLNAASPAVVLSQSLTADATIQAQCLARPEGDTFWRLIVLNGQALTPPHQPGGWYLDGTDVQITTTVPSGKVFVGWTASIANPQFGDPTQISTTIKMTADITVRAIFRSATPPPPNQRDGSGCTDADGIYEAVPTDATGRILGGLLVTNAAPDQCFDWTMTDDGMGPADAPGPGAGTFAGFDNSIAYGRTFSITATNDATGYKALITIRLSPAERAAHAVSVDHLLLCRLDTTQSPAPGRWVPAAANNRGASSPTDSIDDGGFVILSDGSPVFWAVLDRVGIFAVGKPAAPDGQPGDGNGGTDEPGQPTPPTEPFIPACGNCGMGAGSAALFCSLTWAAANLFSTRRRTRRP